MPSVCMADKQRCKSKCIYIDKLSISHYMYIHTPLASLRLLYLCRQLQNRSDSRM